MTREVLPQRRHCETFPLRHGNISFVVSIGQFHDGRPAEVFVNGVKTGSDLEAVTRDGAVLLSLALQHHVEIETIRHAVTRGPDGAPSSIIGAIVDQLER